MNNHRFCKYAAMATAAVLMLGPMASAQKRPAVPRIVTSNCSGCHGLDGKMQSPSVPHLAGLNAIYAEERLAEFKADSEPPVDELLRRVVAPSAPQAGKSRLQGRINMVGIARAITAEESKAATEWYAAQKPAPGRSGNLAMIKAGKVVYDGSPAEGVKSCKACHGAHADGLAGQDRVYLQNSLAGFHAAESENATEMTWVSQRFSSKGFPAIAAYLQSLDPKQGEEEEEEAGPKTGADIPAPAGSAPAAAQSEADRIAQEASIPAAAPTKAQGVKRKP
jgi:cytochrome c553